MTTNPDPQLEHTSTELCPAPPAPAPTRVVDRAPGMRWSWRTDKRFVWVGWQSPELAGVLVPAAGVVIWHWHWAWLSVSVVVAAAWAGHELRNRTRANSRAARPGALTPDQAAGTQTATTD